MAASRLPSCSASLPFPRLRLSHLSEADKRAYVIADNRLAEKAGWDRNLLAIELQDLIDIGFQVELTGFETPEIDLLLEEALEAAGLTPAADDQLPEPRSGIRPPGSMVISGFWAPIGCCVVMRVLLPATPISLTARWWIWCSPTRLTTFASMAMCRDADCSPSRFRHGIRRNDRSRIHSVSISDAWPRR